MNKSFTLVKKGYDPDEVVAYVRKLEQELSDYKQKERFITEALINARAEGQKILVEAEKQGAIIEKENLKKLDYLRSTVRLAKQKLDTFQAGYNQFLQRFSISLNEEVMKGMYATLDELQDSMDINNIIIEETVEAPKVEVPTVEPVQVQIDPYALPDYMIVNDVAPVEEVVITKEEIAPVTTATPVLPETGTLQDIISFKEDANLIDTSTPFVNAAAQLKQNNAYSLFSKIDEYEKKHSISSNDGKSSNIANNLGSYKSGF